MPQFFLLFFRVAAGAGAFVCMSEVRCAFYAFSSGYVSVLCLCAGGPARAASVFAVRVHLCVRGRFDDDDAEEVNVDIGDKNDFTLLTFDGVSHIVALSKWN